MKVSVIIPIYNVAPYIEDTLRSLLAQTMQDFEVLLIDDHGKDRSMGVVRNLVGEDSRFRFLQTPSNAGPGVARNVGIEAAQGEYIAFIDGDDLVESAFLESLYQLTQADGMKGLDLAYCQLQYKGGKRNGKVHHNPVVSTQRFEGKVKRHFLRRFVTFSVCFLFRRDFLLANDLRFPSKRNSEDTNFLTRCLLLAQSIACIDTPLYYYCVREASLTTGHNRGRSLERLTALNSLMQEYRSLMADPRYEALRLKQYRCVMWLIWLKKGLAQALLDIIR